jgi:hypothetical protein
MELRVYPFLEVSSGVAIKLKDICNFSYRLEVNLLAYIVRYIPYNRNIPRSKESLCRFEQDRD